MENQKDLIALAELATIINRLEEIGEAAKENVGKCRPILNSAEIDLIKDHLDLVVKYTRL